MKIYKIRFNCASFQDVVVEAKNEEDAKNKGKALVQCPQFGMEFSEFLTSPDEK